MMTMVTMSRTMTDSHREARANVSQLPESVGRLITASSTCIEFKIVVRIKKMVMNGARNRPR